MNIKYVLIIVLVLLTLVSCTKVEVITDSYWTFLVSDFQGAARKLRLQSLFKGVRLGFFTVNMKEGFPELSEPIVPESDIYLLSPLLSSNANRISEAASTSLVYYFGKQGDPVTNSSDNLIMVVRDRRRSFFEAGKLLSSILDSNFILPVIYCADNLTHKEEALSFIDGLNSGEKKINLVSIEISNTTPEAEIRKYFDKDVVKNSNYLVFFPNKWKSICYEISERDNKSVITSDSWFNNTFSTLILFSIEDDIEGMLKKVYYNGKKKKLADISLEGYICR